ncbi:MAG: 3-deoxy-D-manno-octulosonic acid transferase [Sphingobacteriales bacterium]|nr:MAG: 3-deoxy-D-manno-octulosonic acid transferase [Sphingobacteriales bacterium]
MTSSALTFKSCRLLLFLYNIFIRIYQGLAGLAAHFNPKIKLFVSGRKQLLEQIAADFKQEAQQPVWFHCASLGEFEQGRPLIEALKVAYPETRILLTFFSPSGYEVRKNYSGADYIYYLPVDTKKNAQQFIAITRPQLAIFVKYEFWYHYLNTLKQTGIPGIVVSAIFQERQAFFKWYGALQRKMLQMLHYLFVQNEGSIELLKRIGISNATIAGDTRIDRALAIAHTEKSYPLLQEFKGIHQLIVAGSTWKEDEILLHDALVQLNDPAVKLLIAPHEVHKDHIAQLQERFRAFQPALWSEQQINPDCRVLIVDNIGQLAYLYRYADYTWIGGGFNKTGIHNSIEAAVYGKALTWGPVYNRYQEAIDLIHNGAAFSFSDADAFANQMKKWLQDAQGHEKAGQKARHYIQQNKGATDKILNYLKQQNIS